MASTKPSSQTSSSGRRPMTDADTPQALDDGLRANPYQACLLLERALTRWSLGRRRGAEQDLEVLLAFNPKAGCLARILQLVNRGASVRGELGVFLLDWPREQITPALDAIGSTRAWLAQLGMSVPETLIVLIWSADVARNTVSWEIPRAALIEVGAESLQHRGLRASLAHEIGHVFLRSGRPFLDQGWAYYVQHQIEPGYPYPAPLAEMTAWSRTHEPDRDLRALLCMPESAGPFFEPFAKTDRELESWYCRGVELVHALVATHGILDFCRFMLELAGQQASEATNVFSDCIGESIDAVQARLRGASAPPPAARAAVLADAWRDLRIGRSRRNPALVRDRIATVRVLCHLDADNHEAWRTLALLLIADVVLSWIDGDRLDALSIHEAGALGCELRRAGLCASAELIFGLQAQCEMLLTTSPTDRAKWCVVAKRHLERALAVDAGDPEVLLAFARHELNTPHLGGDPKRGMEFLARVAGFADYAEEVIAARVFYGPRTAASG
jgi:hypothetical protein